MAGLKPIAPADIESVLRGRFAHAVADIPKSGDHEQVWHWVVSCTWNARAEVLNAQINHITGAHGIGRTEAIALLSEALGISDRQIYRLVTHREPGISFDGDNG